MERVALRDLQAASEVVGVAQRDLPVLSQLRGVEHVRERGANLHKSGGASIREHVVLAREDEGRVVLIEISTGTQPVNGLTRAAGERVCGTRSQSAGDIGGFRPTRNTPHKEGAAIANVRHVQCCVEVRQTNPQTHAVGTGERRGGQDRGGIEAAIQRHHSHRLCAAHHTQRSTAQAGHPGKAQDGIWEDVH